MLGGGYPTTVSSASGTAPGVLQAQPGVFGVRSTVLPEVGQTPGPPEPRHPQTPPPCTSPFPVFSMPIMGQIPQIPCFTGDGCATGESFTEWHEHFENVTRLVGWDEHVGIRSNYDQFVAAMKKWFTRIHLTAVQAQLFHNRQQQEKETVDLFAQELQKLYNMGAASEGLNAEIMGQTLLANQYVTGLRPELKRKLIGVEGSMEELLRNHHSPLSW